MTDGHIRVNHAARFTELCEDCWGESDMIDDLFQCSTCSGRHWLCVGCGEPEISCRCEDDDE